jgi:HD-GYP domain-containing protein (c-di-GMP phosphodiesterase class II)
LKGEDIPVGARIFAEADSFDAMTSDRPYRSAMPFETARQEIERGMGRLFDIQVARAFFSISTSRWEALRGEAASIPISSLNSHRPSPRRRNMARAHKKFACN